MKKILMITLNGLKKKKANSIILLFLVALAVMFMYISLSTLSSMDGLISKKIEKANTSDLVISCGKGYADEITAGLSTIEGFESIEEEDSILIGTARTEHKNKVETMMLMIFDYNAERTTCIPYLVGKTASELKSNSVILPYYLHVANSYNAGDELIISTSGGTFTYEIYGFMEDIFFSNPANITCYKFFLASEAYAEIETISEQANSTFFKESFFKINLVEGYSPDEFESAVDTATILTDEMNVQFFINIDSMSVGSTYFNSIILSILLLFSGIIIVICLAVIRFSITSHIENNMRNLGTLSAIGYTSKQLRLSSILEFGIIAGIGGIVGLCLPSVFNGFIAYELESSSGLESGTPFNIVFAIITYLIVLAFIFLISYFSSRKYKTITPLVALRNGFETHSYKKNPFPLSKTKLNKNIALGVKSIFTNFRQSTAILVIIGLLSYTCLTVIFVYQNFVITNGPILNVIGIEKPNVSVSMMSDESKDKFDYYKAQIEQLDGIDFVNTNSTFSLTYSTAESEVSLPTHIYGDISLTQCDSIYKGREPIYANEVAITYNASKILKVGIGDVVYISNDINQAEFYVTGLIQQMSNMGKGARFSTEGMKRIHPDYHPSELYIYLEDGVKTLDFIAENQTRFANTGVEFFNYDATFEIAMGSIAATMETVAMVLAIITIIVVGLITLLIIKMKLLREKKSTGIFKAIGYTSKDLIVQTIISFVPMVIIGAVLGGIICYLTCNNVFALCLSSIGIHSVNLYINVGVLALGVVSISFLAFLITFICALRITKIEPYNMITEI